MQPNHALLPDLLRGYSKFNVIFLKHALDALPLTPEDRDVIAPVGLAVEKSKFDGSNPVIAALMREQSDLFAERGRLSNTLLGFPYTQHYDEKRAVVMDNIKIMQRKIGKVMLDLVHAREYGVLPPVKTTYVVPHDPAERERKKVSLRGSISHKRNDLRKLRDSLVIEDAWDLDKIAVVLDDALLSDEIKEAILSGYEKLNDLKKHLSHVEKAIEADHIHAD